MLAAGGSYLALQRIGLDRIGHSLVTATPVWVLVGLALMCASMIFRAVAWHAILKAALPAMRPRLVDAIQGTTIGVLMSATLPARLGEPSRALIVARRLGRPREALPVVLGTLVSQTLLNLLALVILGAVMFSTVGLFAGRQQALLWYAVAPIAIVLLVLATPALLRSGLPSRSARVHRWLQQARDGHRRACATASSSSAARATARRRSRCSSAPGRVQWLSCYVLMVALGLDAHGADLGAAAAVLFAVNVSAVLPLTPSNLGVFQAACVAVLTGAYGIGAGRRARLRDHPAGRRGGHGRDHGRPRAGQGGALLARRAPARAAQRAGRAAPARARGRGARLSQAARIAQARSSSGPEAAISAAASAASAFMFFSLASSRSSEASSRWSCSRM